MKITKWGMHDQREEHGAFGMIPLAFVRRSRSLYKLTEVLVE